VLGAGMSEVKKDKLKWIIVYEKNNNQGFWIPIGVAVGTSIGVAIGVTTDN